MPLGLAFTGARIATRLAVGGAIVATTPNSSAPTMPGSTEGLQRRPLWVPDSAAPSCETCGRGFGPTLRRHHCRVCGCVFCTACCFEKVHLPSLGYSTPQLVCNECIRGAPDVIGTFVVVNPDVAVVRRLCAASTTLPPWDPRKAAFCGSVGRIDAQDKRDGNVKVTFSTGLYSWYPPSCLAVGDPSKFATTETAPRLVVSCPSKPYLEGAYSKLAVKKNCVSIWSMSTCRIYSNPLGNWAVTISPEGMQREQGNVRSKHRHGGKIHAHMMKEWETYVNGKWVPLPDFSISKTIVSATSAPGTNSSLKHVQTLYQPGLSERQASPPAPQAPQRQVQLAPPHIAAAAVPQMHQQPPVMPVAQHPGAFQPVQQFVPAAPAQQAPPVYTPVAVAPAVLPQVAAAQPVQQFVPPAPVEQQAAPAVPCAAPQLPQQPEVSEVAPEVQNAEHVDPVPTRDASPEPSSSEAPSPVEEFVMEEAATAVTGARAECDMGSPTLDEGVNEEYTDSPLPVTKEGSPEPSPEAAEGESRASAEPVTPAEGAGVETHSPTPEEADAADAEVALITPSALPEAGRCQQVQVQVGGEFHVIDLVE